MANYICYNQLPPQARSIEKAIAATCGTEDTIEQSRSRNYEWCVMRKYD
ncbi:MULTISPECIES: hypothetical protein [unclassified Roseofilum]|nr:MULTISPECIES: hypothetical protein [unclassified Roseofilum]MBP0007623.1 hypothetical protein [Roseofilum sp. Belize Diploria]MBP0034128.1 hypothetical protein [Roseofilum sp. Belize BBD 4]